MASPEAAILELLIGPGTKPASRGPLGGVGREDARALRRADSLSEVDRRLVALCRERGPLRVVLARIAHRLVTLRTWERLGYARASDYAAECLGLSSRWLRSLARVGARLRDFPGLEEALVSGALGWTKVRLLAQLPPEEEPARWIAFARRVTAERLAKAVRAMAGGSDEVDAAEEGRESSRVFEVRCTPEVRWKWELARQAAARVAGETLDVSAEAEVIAAEVLSSLPIDEAAEAEAAEESQAPWRWEFGAAQDHTDSAESDSKLGPGPEDGEGVDAATGEVRRSVGLPPALAGLVDGLEQADAFEAHARLLKAMSLEHRLEARTGPLLERVWGRWVHRALGYATREAYARERLGMDPSRARTLVRLERTAAASPAFAEAYRGGELSWVKAGLLAT